MKFFVFAFILAVAVASMADAKSVNSESIEPVQTKETLDNNVRDKRGYVLGAYTAPVAYSAAYTAPVAYAASYSYPYAYAGYPYYASAYAAPYYVA